MATRDLVHSIKTLPSIAAAAAVTTDTSISAGVNSLDTLGWESVTVVLIAHTLSAGTIQLFIQDSDDGTTWGAITDTTLCLPATQLIGGQPAALAAAGVVQVGLLDSKRYIRAVRKTTGYTGIASAHVTLGHPRHRSPAV
jgi:hypothetical protein